MPRPPDLMDFVTWKTDTAVKKWHGQSDKARGTGLQAVDSALQQYQGDKTPGNMEWLYNQLVAWIASKTKGGVVKSMRDQAPVDRLKRAIEIAMTLVKPVAWSWEFPGIFIAYDNYRGNRWVPDNFTTVVDEGLNTICTKPVGRSVLASIAKRYRTDPTKKVIIEYNGSMSNAAPVPETSNAFRKKIQLGPMMGGEAGFAAGLMRNPDIVGTTTGNLLRGGTIKEYVGGTGAACVIGFNHEDNGLDGRPKFIALAHELIHAFHYLNGMCYRGIGDFIQDGGNTGIMEEEMRTVGIGRYAAELPSENAVRAEHRIALRAAYNPNQDWSHVVASAFP